MQKHSACHSLKALDLYGKKVDLTFEHQDQFRSWIGTLCSIIGLGLFLAFSAFRTQKLILQDDPVLSTVTLPEDG